MVKDIWSFLGFCNFYRAFIKNFLDIAHPLNDLTCKNEQFIWSEVYNNAFPLPFTLEASFPQKRTMMYMIKNMLEWSLDLNVAAHCS